MLGCHEADRSRRDVEDYPFVCPLKAVIHAQPDCSVRNDTDERSVQTLRTSCSQISIRKKARHASNADMTGSYLEMLGIFWIDKAHTGDIMHNNKGDSNGKKA